MGSVVPSGFVHLRQEGMPSLGWTLETGVGRRGSGTNEKKVAESFMFLNPNF